MLVKIIETKLKQRPDGVNKARYPRVSYCFQDIYLRMITCIYTNLLVFELNKHVREKEKKKAAINMAFY